MEARGAVHLAVHTHKQVKLGCTWELAGYTSKEYCCTWELLGCTLGQSKGPEDTVHHTAETWGIAEGTVEGMAAAYTAAERDKPSRIRMAVAGKQAGRASAAAEGLLTLQRLEAGSQAAEVSQPQVGCTLAYLDCSGEP